jgi:hypothetical protein
MSYGVPDKVDNRFLTVAKNISDDDFKNKYGNLHRLFNGDVTRAMAFADAIKFRESSGNPSLVNQIGYTGWFQMREDTSFSETDYVKKNANGGTSWTKKGEEAAKKIGVEGIKEGQNVERSAFQKLFKDTPESHAFQADAFFQYLNKVVTYPKSKETVEKLVGSGTNNEVTFKGEKYPATIEGTLAAIHLLGHSGSNEALVKGRGGKDGNGTTAQEYVATFSGKFKNNKTGEAYWEREDIYKQIAVARGGVTPQTNTAQLPNNSTTNKPTNNNQPAGSNQPTVTNPYPTNQSQEMQQMLIFLTILAEIVKQFSEKQDTSKAQTAPQPANSQANFVQPPLETPKVPANTAQPTRTAVPQR